MSSPETCFFDRSAISEFRSQKSSVLRMKMQKNLIELTRKKLIILEMKKERALQRFKASHLRDQRLAEANVRSSHKKQIPPRPKLAENRQFPRECSTNREYRDLLATMKDKKNKRREGVLAQMKLEQFRRQEQQRKRLQCLRVKLNRQSARSRVSTFFKRKKQQFQLSRQREEENEDKKLEHLQKQLLEPLMQREAELRYVLSEPVWSQIVNCQQ